MVRIFELLDVDLNDPRTGLSLAAALAAPALTYRACSRGCAVATSGVAGRDVVTMAR